MLITPISFSNSKISFMGSQNIQSQNSHQSNLTIQEDKKRESMYKQVDEKFPSEKVKLVLTSQATIFPMHISSVLYEVIDYLDSKINRKEFEERINNRAKSLAVRYVDDPRNKDLGLYSKPIALIYSLAQICDKDQNATLKSSEQLDDDADFNSKIETQLQKYIN